MPPQAASARHSAAARVLRVEHMESPGGKGGRRRPSSYIRGTGGPSVNRTTAEGALSACGAGLIQVSAMSLRAQALREFNLPTAPQRIDERGGSC